MQKRTGSAPAAVDDEFLHQLYRGGELLAAGKVIEAKDYLEKAHKLQPKNEKGQNLLGLTYFKLGLFDRASEIYEALVRENPADPTLRVNLGLVHLKTNALDKAVREFETATDLAPEHKKAHNYLGLALAQAGEYARAKDHFSQAGSDAMVEKMDRALKGESYGKQRETPLATQKGFAEIPGAEVVAEKGGTPVEEARPPVALPPASDPYAVPPGDPTAAPASPEEELRFAEDEGPSHPANRNGAPAHAAAENDWGAQAEGPAQPPLAEEQPVLDAAEVATQEPPTAAEQAPIAEVEVQPAHAEPPAPAVHAEPAAAPPLEGPPPEGAATAAPPADDFDFGVPKEEPAAPSGPPPPRPPTLVELALAHPLFPGLDVAHAFSVGPEAAAIRVRGELFTRLTRTLLVGGDLDFVPERKKFRGRSTEKPFGEGELRMVRAKGDGFIVVDGQGRSFVPTQLAEEGAYIREEFVFAFEEAVMFENGRIPSEVAPDLDLIHLRGEGLVLLTLPGALRSQRVTPGQKVRIPLAFWVGWQGNLTPKMVLLGDPDKGLPSRPAVELTGDGQALLSLPKA